MKHPSIWRGSATRSRAPLAAVSLVTCLWLSFAASAQPAPTATNPPQPAPTAPTPARWDQNDLTNAAGAPGAAGDPAGYTWDVDKTQHVVYRGSDSHIHELWLSGLSFPSNWNHNDLTNAAGAPGAAGVPTGYTWDVDKTEHVDYRGTDGHIHELWFNGAWNHNDLTNATPIPTRAPGAASDPAGYTWDVDKTQHVVYLGSDGHIHELWFNGALLV
jgi:hypothetical protein